MQSDIKERRRILRRIGGLQISDNTKRALSAAVEDLLLDSDVLGVALWGSIACNKPDPKDIDLVVLIRGAKYATRRRLYFGESVHMLIRGIERFKSSKHLPLPFAPPLADSVILWDYENTFASARSRQRRIRARGPGKISANEQMKLRAELTESLEDLESCGNDKTTFMLLATQLIARCGEVHIRLQGFWTPTRKKLFSELEAVAPDFAILSKEALAQIGRPRLCIPIIRRLAANALSPIGGLVGEYEIIWD